jgi:hypothetical protein
MAEHVSMRFGRERKPQIIVGKKMRASKWRDDRDRWRSRFQAAST